MNDFRMMSHKEYAEALCKGQNIEEHLAQTIWSIQKLPEFKRDLLEPKEISFASPDNAPSGRDFIGCLFAFEKIPEGRFSPDDLISKLGADIAGKLKELNVSAIERSSNHLKISFDRKLQPINNKDGVLTFEREISFYFSANGSSVTLDRIRGVEAHSRSRLLSMFSVSVTRATLTSNENGSVTIQGHGKFGFVEGDRTITVL